MDHPIISLENGDMHHICQSLLENSIFRISNIPRECLILKNKLQKAKKARDIKTIGIEYERQLNAMRRGYVQWRYQTRKAKLDKKHENAARPHPPPPPPFKPTFAEEMAEPSSTNQLAIEQRLFANIHTPQSRRVRGAGYQSAHHQAFLARQRRTLINEYLALYHTSHNFITTPESLESEILRNFQDTYVGMDASRPQSYSSILHDAEHGTTGSVFDGYISLMNKDKENELYNAVIGTVAEKGNLGMMRLSGKLRLLLEMNRLQWRTIRQYRLRRLDLRNPRLLFLLNKLWRKVRLRLRRNNLHKKIYPEVAKRL